MPDEYTKIKPSDAEEGEAPPPPSSRSTTSPLGPVSKRPSAMALGSAPLALGTGPLPSAGAEPLFPSPDQPRGSRPLVPPGEESEAGPHVAPDTLVGTLGGPSRGTTGELKSGAHRSTERGARADQFIRSRSPSELARIGTAPIKDLESGEEGEPAAPIPLGPQSMASAAAKWDGVKAQAEEILRTGELVLKPMETKITALRIALDLAERQPADAEMRLACLPQEIHGLIRGIIGRLHGTPGLPRQMQVALFQFGDASRATALLRDRFNRALEMEPGEAYVWLSGVDLPKVRGKLYTLTNFPLVFSRDPVLSRLFPGKSKTSPERKPGPPGTVSPTGPLSALKAQTGTSAPLPVLPASAANPDGARRHTEPLPAVPTTTTPPTTEAPEAIARADLWNTMREKINRFKPKS